MNAAPTAVFAALADDTRWSILQRVAEQPASASALARDLTISRQAIARHLEVLRSAGLVDTSRDGREVTYQALGAAVSALARQLDLIAAGWDVRLASLKVDAEKGGARHSGS